MQQAEFFSVALARPEKIKVYGAKQASSPNRYTNPRDVINFMLQSSSAYMKAYYQKDLGVNRITAFNTDYPITISPITKISKFIPKYFAFRFTLPGAIFGGGGPDILGNLSACPIESLTIQYDSVTIDTIYKHEIMDFMENQYRDVQDIIDNYMWTRKADVSVNPNTTTVLVPWPMSEAFDLNRIIDDKLVVTLKTCTQANYGTSGAGVVRLDNGAGSVLSSAFWIMGIVGRSPPTPVTGIIETSYMSPRYVREPIYTFTTGAGVTDHTVEYKFTHSATVSSISLMITQSLFSSPDYYEIEENVIQGIRISSENQEFYKIEGPELHDSMTIFNALTQGTYRNTPGIYTIDLSNHCKQEYETDNILPQNLMNPYRWTISIDLVGLTALTTYYVYVSFFQVSKLQILYNEASSIKEIKVIKLNEEGGLQVK